jgi:predicted CXXCH cytochrome family protein
MQRSRCYQASGTMTCTTCHDPHAKPSASRTVAYFRSKCLACHTSPAKTCSLAEDVRRARDAQDNCASCHMPRGPTAVPHTSFTHHRIGHHQERPGPGAPRKDPGTLVPTADVSHLSEIDRDRCLGLAYWEAVSDPRLEHHADTYVQRARELLTGVRERGLRDPVADAALARMLGRADPDRAIELAESVLRSDAASPSTRLAVLVVLADLAHARDQTERAEGYLRQLTR